MTAMAASAMTPRERVLAAIRREPVDRVPLTAAFNPLSAVQRRGHTWQFPWPPDASRDEQIRYQVEELGLDQVVAAGVSVSRPAPGVESKVWREVDVLHKTYATPSGELHAAVRYDDRWPHGEDIPFYSDFNIAHFVEPWVRDEADLACLEDIQTLADTPDVVGQARANVAAAKALADRYSLATTAHVGMGMTGLMQLCGATELCVMTKRQPGLVDAYLEHEHRLNVRAIEIAGEAGVDVIWRNGFYETADFYGPAMLEEFLGARLRREADATHAGGAAMVYTAHTGLMPILDYLAGLTLDSVFGSDIAFAGVDPAAIRDKLSATKSFWTGPSSTYHLWKGPESTRQAVRDVFETFGKQGLILSPCVSSHSIMPWESTLAMVDEWKKLR